MSAFGFKRRSFVMYKGFFDVARSDRQYTDSHWRHSKIVRDTGLFQGEVEGKKRGRVSRLSRGRRQPVRGEKVGSGQRKGFESG